VVASSLSIDFPGFEWAPNRVLENLVPYVANYEGVVDLPWLEVSPESGSVAPGTAQPLSVTVDTTGLEPRFYRARISISTNDPRNPQLQVPVTVLVPAYQRALNAGGAVFTDSKGDAWLADAKYTAQRGFGYIKANSTTVTTKRDILGTTDDALSKNVRQDPTAYRFDGLPAGT
jgi:hypothetical protein